MIWNPSVSGGGGGAVSVDTNNPETHSGSYTYTDNDAIVVVRSQYKSYAYVQYNLVTMTYICRDTGMYGENDNPTLAVYNIPNSLTLTFDGVSEISSINTVTKTITGDSITAYKKS